MPKTDDPLSVVHALEIWPEDPTVPASPEVVRILADEIARRHLKLERLQLARDVIQQRMKGGGA